MVKPHIRILKDGPLVVSGDVPLYRSTILTDAEGYSIGYSDPVRVPTGETYQLCRCGGSAHPPFCDGCHRSTGFDGTETADRRPYAEQAETTEGPGAVLYDVLPLCAGTRHCSIAQGDTWELTERSGDPESKEAAIRTAQLCPAGRLVIREAGAADVLEPDHAPSILLLEDPEGGASGPIWVRGRIPVESSDGTPYEVRNRVTLCRCGMSRNKPFCDGTHLREGWTEKHA